MDKRNHLSPDINNHRSLHLLIGRVIRKRKSWNGNLYSSLVSYTDPINIEERFGCTFCISRILKIATFCVGYTLPHGVFVEFQIYEIFLLLHGQDETE